MRSSSGSAQGSRLDGPLSCTSSTEGAADPKVTVPAPRRLTSESCGGRHIGNERAYSPRPTRPQASPQDLEIARLRRQHLTRVLHGFGARTTFEFIDELARHHGIGDDLDERLAKYAALDPTIVRLVGGDRFPPHPPRAVP
jgi:hypothetical protein